MLLMRTKKVVVLLDLDGVLATRDIAFDLFKAHGLGKEYRDASREIADAVNANKEFKGKKAYAGMTVKYMMSEFGRYNKIPVKEIRDLASEARLIKGSKGLVLALKKNPAVKDVFIISTTYKPAADVIAKRLGIRPENVFATNLQVVNGNVVRVMGPACGGIHKASVVDKISAATSTPFSRMVAVGDSITDIGMMEKVVKGGGLGIAFNANNDLLKREPNVIYAGSSLKPAYGLVTAFASNGLKGVKKIVDRNIKLRRSIGIPMSMIGRPFLFRPGVKDAKAARKSEKFRAKVRTKRIARLR